MVFKCKVEYIDFRINGLWYRFIIPSEFANYIGYVDDDNKMLMQFQDSGLTRIAVSQDVFDMYFEEISN
jgi:hypothetical protein